MFAPTLPPSQPSAGRCNSLHDATISYGNRAAVHHLSGEVARVSLTGIVGANGSEKSTYVIHITSAFCAVDADGCPTYQANAAAYREKLAELDGETHDTVPALPENRRTVVVAHYALRYFEEAYCIRVLSPHGASTASEAAAADLASLIREIREHKAGAVFAENISDTRLLEPIVAESGLELVGTLYSHALSGKDGPAAHYLAMMRHNAQTISAALAADSHPPQSTG